MALLWLLPLLALVYLASLFILVAYPVYYRHTIITALILQVELLFAFCSPPNKKLDSICSLLALSNFLVRICIDGALNSFGYFLIFIVGIRIYLPDPLKIPQLAARKKSVTAGKFVLVVFLAVMLVNSFVYLNYSLYPVIGQLVNVDADFLRINCNQANSTPVIIFEHGGGSNGIYFQPLMRQLEFSGVKACSYDRAGYGKSTQSQQTSQNRAKKLRKLLQQIGVQPPYLLVGHSVGGQVIQFFQHLYPQLCKGLVLIDSYPDYLLLQAITKNLGQDWYKSQVRAQSNLLRFLSLFEATLLTDIFVGSFQSTYLGSYLTAYYRTSHFWDTSLKDFTSNDLTSSLTAAGQAQNRSNPYQFQNLAINWPQARCPTLVILASETIKEQMYLDYGVRYQQSTGGKLLIIQGNHNLVLENTQQLKEALMNFNEIV